VGVCGVELVGNIQANRNFMNTFISLAQEVFKSANCFQYFSRLGTFPGKRQGATQSGMPVAIVDKGAKQVSMSHMSNPFEMSSYTALQFRFALPALELFCL